jgi:hypothetical protein
MHRGGSSIPPSQSNWRVGNPRIYGRDKRCRGFVNVYARQSVPQNRTILTKMAKATFGNQAQEEAG